ncbi:hypothetical protein Syun_008378 [Stephania yunnanensis]|uniref:Wax synthase domain-containing protein n=1 Tax=Stephania yunnanensis TaxID=152371 RepID=A0AAP0PPJ1_9MAGN
MENCNSSTSAAVHDEMKSFIEVCVTSIASLMYCYFISFNLSKGKTRVISLIPVIILFTLLPLRLHTITLTGTTGFFLHLASLKLLLFAFGRKPLETNPPIPLTLFICIAFLPIKINHKNSTTKSNYKNQEDPTKIESENKENITNLEHPSRKSSNPPLNLTVKCGFLGLLWIIYQFRQYIHPKIMLAYYCFYIYISTELVLAIASVMAWASLGLELEPHFNEPYMATSLQDFWGRRWNLIMSNALRSTVYLPMKKWVSSRSAFGSRYATIVAVMGTFVVSGLEHELMFYYFGRLRPSWEVTGFFVLQGLVVIVEIVVKKFLLMKGITWRTNRVVSGVLVIGFVMVSAMWLFFPPVLRCNTVVRTEREVTVVVESLKGSFNVLNSFVKGK